MSEHNFDAKVDAIVEARRIAILLYQQIEIWRNR